MFVCACVYIGTCAYACVCVSSLHLIFASCSIWSFAIAISPAAPNEYNAILGDLCLFCSAIMALVGVTCSPYLAPRCFNFIQFALVFHTPPNTSKHIHRHSVCLLCTLFAKLLNTLHFHKLRTTLCATSKQLLFHPLLIAFLLNTSATGVDTIFWALIFSSKCISSKNSSAP